MSTSHTGKLNIILIGVLTGLQEYLMWEALYIAMGVCVSLHPGTYKIGEIEIKCNSLVTLSTSKSFETLNWFSGS